MKNIVNKLIFWPVKSEYNRLFSFDDEYNKENEFESLFLKKGSHALVSHQLVYFLFLISSYFAYYDNRYLIVLIILFFIFILTSYILNFYSYYPTASLYIKLFPEFSNNLINYLTKENSYKLQNISSLLSGYAGIVTKVLSKLSTNLIFLIVISRELPNPIFYILFIIFLFSIFLVSGRTFFKSYKRISDSILKNEPVNKWTLFLRLSLPSVSNSGLLFQLALPIVVLSLKMELDYYVFNVLTSTLSIALAMWSITEDIQRIKLGKTYMNDVIQALEEASKKYIINSSCYSKLCKKCIPTSTLINRSSKNRSLILQSFEPMIITNSDRINHSFTYEFLCGKMYQINGINGIGKTTLVQSLCLPKGIKVEYSKGEVAFKGKPFFNLDSSLIMHRSRFVYVGAESLQDDYKLIDKTLFKNSKLISKIIKSIEDNDKEKLSEGERAIVKVAVTLTNIIKAKNKPEILVLDEIISRIYNEEEFKLRSEFVNLIEEYTKKYGIITFIIDHMSKVKSAEQIYMKENKEKRVIELTKFA